MLFRSKDSLATAVEYGDLRMVIRNQLSLGSLNVAQGRVGEAREHLHTALQAAIQLNQRPLLLDCLAPFAELFMAEGDRDDAALLVMLVTADPAGRAMTKERGAYLLAHIEAVLSADEMDAARQRSRTSDLAAVVAQLLSELETPLQSSSVKGKEVYK